MKTDAFREKSLRSVRLFVSYLIFCRENCVMENFGTHLSEQASLLLKLINLKLHTGSVEKYENQMSRVRSGKKRRLRGSEL
jgi:hypothetical protein